MRSRAFLTRTICRQPWISTCISTVIDIQRKHNKLGRRIAVIVVDNRAGTGSTYKCVELRQRASERDRIGIVSHYRHAGVTSCKRNVAFARNKRRGHRTCSSINISDAETGAVNVQISLLIH